MAIRGNVSCILGVAVIALSGCDSSSNVSNSDSSRAHANNAPVEMATGEYPSAGTPTPSPSSSSNPNQGQYPNPTPTGTSGQYPATSTPTPNPTSTSGQYPSNPSPSPTSTSSHGGSGNGIYPGIGSIFGSLGGTGNYPGLSSILGSLGGTGDYPNGIGSTNGNGGYPNGNGNGNGGYPNGTTAGTGTTAGSGAYPTSITVNPGGVCAPSVNGQATLANTTSSVAVLYAVKGVDSSSTNVVQAWDSSSDTTLLYAELSALKPFQLSLNSPLQPGTYALVFYNANDVSSSSYKYTPNNSKSAIAPIEDTICSFLDWNALITVNSNGSVSNPSSYAVVVAFQGASACNGMGMIDPLTINLGSQPIALSSQAKGVSMDLDGNGKMDQISWPQQPAQVTFLVNLSGGMPANGAIGPQQIFGNFTVGPDGQVAANGYDALAKYDDNGDGVIDSKDKIWPNLRIWQDLNRNGVADSGELLTLAQAGISSIELPATSNNHIVKENCTNDQYGNQICQGRNAYVNLISNGQAVRKQLVDIGFKPSN